VHKLYKKGEGIASWGTLVIMGAIVEFPVFYFCYKGSVIEVGLEEEKMRRRKNFFFKIYT